VFEVWNSSDDRRYGFTMLISGAGAVYEGPIVCQPERDFLFALLFRQSGVWRVYTRSQRATTERGTTVHGVAVKTTCFCVTDETAGG